MPNYINPYAIKSFSRSIGTTSARSTSNAWGSNIATRDKIGLYTKGSEIATRSKIGLNEIGGSFNSGAGTFGGSNSSSYNNKLLNKDKDINSFGNSYMRSLNSF